MFSQRLRDLRKEFGYTATVLASKLNCSINLIYEWEHERCEANHSTLIELSKIFGVTIDYLLGLEDEMPGRTSPTLGNLSKEELHVLELYNKLGAFERKALLVQLEALSEKQPSKV